MPESEAPESRTAWKGSPTRFSRESMSSGGSSVGVVSGDVLRVEPEELIEPTEPRVGLTRFWDDMSLPSRTDRNNSSASQSLA